MGRLHDNIQHSGPDGGELGGKSRDSAQRYEATLTTLHQNQSEVRGGDRGPMKGEGRDKVGVGVSRQHTAGPGWDRLLAGSRVHHADTSDRQTWAQGMRPGARGYSRSLLQQAAPGPVREPLPPEQTASPAGLSLIEGGTEVSSWKIEGPSRKRWQVFKGSHAHLPWPLG